MRRAVLAAAVTAIVLLSSACSEPPQKEIDRAQGAIDAARAAGAEQYAREPFLAATAALEQTHDAVQQRDYRLALSRAIDANERALDAATAAADNKAKARSEAESALSIATAALRELDDRLKAAEAAKVPAKEMESARQLRASADRQLQEARAGLAGGKFLDIAAAATKTIEQVRAGSQALNEIVESKSPRGPRRRR
jgi:hypothetical protein